MPHVAPNATLASMRYALVLFLLAPALFAQAAKLDVPSVSTTGQATVNVVPDVVEIVVGVEQKDADAAKAKRTCDTTVASLLRIAAAHGIEPRSVKTDYIDLDFEELSKVYWARKTVVLTSLDITGFESLLSDLVRGGANHIASIRFLSSDVRKYRDEARKLATKAAREKAQLLAESLGGRVGNALTINEGNNGWDWGSSWWGRYNLNANSNTFVSGGAERTTGDSSLAPGQIACSATVSVTFELLSGEGSSK